MTGLQCKSRVQRHRRSRWAQKAEAGGQESWGKGAGELRPAGGEGGLGVNRTWFRQRAKHVQRRGWEGQSVFLTLGSQDPRGSFLVLCPAAELP